MSGSTQLFEEAQKKWGMTAQLMMATEECAELIVAVNHALRGRGAPEALAEEIADVEIMMAQLRVIVGPEVVDFYKDQKLARLRTRVESS